MIATPIILALIDFVVGAAEALIGIRVFLKLLAANPQSSFVHWVYSMTQPLVAPFMGMFPSPAVNGTYVLEFSALAALIVYGIVGMILSQLVRFLDRDFNHPEHHHKDHHY